MTGASFASDNHAGVHPEVLAAILAADGGYATAYGDDPVTAEAVRLFRRELGEQVEVFPVFNGTGANVVGLQSMLRTYEAVVCAETAHINVDECGAPERFLGAKLIDVPTPDGKLTVEAVDRAVWGIGDLHHVQTRVLSLTQSTELGTVYTLDELAALTSWAHEHALFVHLDGARLSNAAVSLGVGIAELSAGIDVLSYGGTKNGAMGVEAVVVLNPELAHVMPFVRKQAMQLGSKMRYLSAQLVALLTDDLWRRNATHANAMAARLAAAVDGAVGVELTGAVDANAVFAILDPAVTAKLQAEYAFYVWNEATGQVRWMTSWSTTEADVDAFAARVRELAGQVSRG